jgi:hypothetical protein
MGLEGSWYNELGSTLTLEVGSDGSLLGSYKTGVSDGGCAKGEYPVAGRTDVPFEGSTFGFSVTWRNQESGCESTTTWVGHYRPGGDVQEESLSTFWLLAETAGTGEEWESLLLGKDVFTRQTVSLEVGESKARQRAPHP